ncbi:hypothetical protein EJ04DRAFT_529246 [Polyplosphaeria fusca]|uniref:Zinc finger Mcm10/DnaG-type domain-containing protein n=1 Tax=Polyplosphaeria fusca TaxID=682080 RepID=A0A9P4QJX3_9PLEO|nr:hypothetical protein EJ04DRAFT_529246 [Polyplosphaeria fusca]
MIVRESPKAKVSNPSKNWPPKSPHEALLSSPSGRKKYERHRDRDSASPSPTKRRPLPRGMPADDEEEDEETLQLQLQEIQARLKLKKLQKARQATEEDAEDGAKSRPTPRPGTAPGLRKTELPRPEPEVQVPVSPIRRRAPEEQTSPARRLGIDKGLRAQDVSLKRAASFSTRAIGESSRTLSRAQSTRAVETPRGKSFSERLAEARNKDKAREEKQDKIERSRSQGFGLKNILADIATPRSGSALSSGTGTSENLAPPKSMNMAKSRSVGDLKTAPSPRPSSGFSSRSGNSRAPSAASQASTSTQRSAAQTKYSEIAERDNGTEAASFEAFSGLHLKTRDMQHTTLTRTLDGKTVFTLPQLLKVVKAPEYDPPDMENDFVVMGVIASKSEPLNTKSNARDNSTNRSDQNVNQSGKFMVIRLTDLKWEVDLYLFDTGFTQFWKLPIGTLVAILNPEIMRPRERDSGKFSLKLASSDDTILEVGMARDLDFCHAIRKDGKQCSAWVDSRKTEYCDFHIEIQVEKAKRGRMEVNTMTGFGKGPGGGTGKFGMFGGRGRGVGLKDDGLTREGRFRDRLLHETVYIAPSAGGTARLLDQDETGWERGASRAEMHRKRLAEKEKERELAKKLGQIGSGAGGDYMRVKGAGTQNLPARGDFQMTEPGASNQDTKEDVLGLLGKKADDVSLSPVKRKRNLSGKSTTSSAPVGWGGAYKRGLLLSPTKETDSAQSKRETSPAKKKARLLLPEKGIREPGRDSLGTLDVGLLAAMDDDDDLEIV